MGPVGLWVSTPDLLSPRVTAPGLPCVKMQGLVPIRQAYVQGVVIHSTSKRPRSLDLARVPRPRRCFIHAYSKKPSWSAVFCR